MNTDPSRLTEREALWRLLSIALIFEVLQV